MVPHSFGGHLEPHWSSLQVMLFLSCGHTGGWCEKHFNPPFGTDLYAQFFISCFSADAALWIRKPRSRQMHMVQCLLLLSGDNVRAGLVEAFHCSCHTSALPVLTVLGIGDLSSSIVRPESERCEMIYRGKRSLLLSNLRNRKLSINVTTPQSTRREYQETF